MRTKKRFSVIFLILVLIASFSIFMVACDEEGGGEYPITKLVISTLPKTEYYMGDKFELGNAQLTVYYENDTKETVDLTLNMVSEFSTTSIGEQTLTIKYKEAVAYLTVNVISAPVYSLQVESVEHKTEYVVGEQLNVDGLKILVTYSNGYTSVVDVTADMVTGFNTESTGEKQIVISYGNRTCNMAIRVVRRSVMQMQLVAPEKLDYIVGDEIDLGGGQLFVSYNDNTSEYINLVDLYSAGDLGIVIAGEESTTFTRSQLSCVVTLYYSDRTFSYAVVVDAKKATSAAVTNDVKSQIFESAAPDFSDGIITITYNNGEVAKKGFYDDGIVLNLEQFDINRLGVYDIGINADGLYFEHKVEVISASPSELVIIPSRNTFYQDEVIDVTEWQYQIKLNNGKFNLISSTGSYYANVTENMFVGKIEEIDNYNVGKQKFAFTITMTDNTVLNANVEIEILAKEIVDAIVTPPTKTVYSVGDVISLSGAKLVVTYNNGDVSDEIELTSDMLVDANGESADLNSFTNGVHDKLTLHVNYKDDRYATSIITSFDIKVIKKAISLEIISQPKSNYVLGEAFDDSDWQVIIRYSDESTVTINEFDGVEWTFDNVVFDELGTRKIRLYYGADVYVEYAVTVSNEISRIYTDRPFIGFVTEGKAIDYSGVKLNVIRENGELARIDISADMSNYVPNKTFVPNSYSYVPAFVDASELAKEDHISNNWATSYLSYYVRTNNGYASASVDYNEEEIYYASVTEYYSENWNEVYYNFYVYDSEKLCYLRASEQFDANQEYYLASSNIYDVNVTYLNKTVVIKAFVESKKINSVSVSGIGQRYIVSNDDWDMDEAEVTVNFNNNTTKVVFGSDLSQLNGSTYSFVNNGMTYVLNVGIFDGNEFVEFTLDEFIDRFETSNDQYQTENLVIRVEDYATSKQYFTNDNAVYCFENLVKSIVAVIGDYDGTEVLTYQDQKVYVNAGLDLFEKAFVIADDSQRVDFESNVYLSISYENGTNDFISVKDATGVNGFEMSGFDTSKAGAQIIKITHLLSECTLALEVRPNVIKSLHIGEQSITVIEGVALQSGDVTITATMVDADGMSIDGEVAVDLLDVVGNYDHIQEITFSNKDENGYYSLQEFKVSYGSVVSNSVQLIVRKKSLIGVSMKDMPKQIYIEDATGNTSIDYTDGSIMLLYNNGTNKTVSLTDASVKIDASEFNANLELTGAGQQSQTIRISYTDENNITHNTQYNVIIKDRKYLAITFEDLPTDNKYNYQYGTGENAGPKYSISYYQSFDGESLNMSRGEGKDGAYKLTYINNATGYAQTEWPTEVGIYTLNFSYDGDTINNEFFDDSIVVEILRKEIAIKVSDHDLVYGDIFVGATNADIGFEWKMQGIVNGVLTDNPYCYEDTVDSVVEHVEFDVLNTLGSKIIFKSLTVNNVAKFVINANVGEYVIVPKITLKSDNYFVSTTYTNVNAKLTINKREIIVVADDTFKIYGSNNPEFKYEVYDYAQIVEYLLSNGEISDESELSQNKLQSIDFESIKSAQNRVLPFGNQNRLHYFFDEDYSHLYNGEDFNIVEQSTIYSDNAIAQYRLTRPISDNENVGEHVIYGGDNNILTNYSIYFVNGILNIGKADLAVGGADLNRYYGTIFAEPNYSIAGNTTLKYFDSFSELFGDYFDVEDVIFYNDTEKTFAREITDNYYDSWSVLYKNVRIYSDKECTIEAGEFLENITFNIAGVQYFGSYAALPIDIAVGEYYAVIDFTNIDLHNYTVEQYTKDSNKYAFTITIQQVEVDINVESIIVSENEYVTDDNSRYLSSYFKFESNGLNVMNLSRADLINEQFIDELFKDKIIEVAYKDKDGNPVNYVLSDTYLMDNYKFYKKSLNNIGADEKVTADGLSRAGTYTIGITASSDDTVENYVIALTSKFVEHNQNYVDFFHNIWGLRYDINKLQDENVSFATDAYMIVLPTYANVAYGNGAYDLHQEVYNRVSYENWTLDTYRNINGSDYVEYNENGISFTIANKDELMNSLSYMVVGEYDGVMTYSFFDTVERNYLYLGDNVMLSDVNAAKIINYVLFNKESEIKYDEAFEYKVTPIILDAVVSGVEVNEGEVENTVYFDESEKVLLVAFDGNVDSIFNTDKFSLKFDVEVTYNARTETSVYKNTDVYAYHHQYRENYLEDKITTNTATSSFRLLNAGVYKVKLASLGNMNYAIGNNIDCTITILSINLPIYLTEDITDENNALTITRPYTGKSIQPIDYNWKAAADQHADYSYGSTTCKIVNEYYPLGENAPVPTILAAAPRTLRVYAADEEGNYPVNVKKTNNKLDGYNISYHITSDFVNYSVVFVYKDGDKYVECEDGNSYKLIISPKLTYIFNFNKVNTKVYDGADAEISAINRNIITVMEDEITGDKKNIKFTFKRVDAEGSTYITSASGEKYNIIDQNDISSVGTLSVEAYYSDNYDLAFDKGVYQNGNDTDARIGVYTITKKTVNMNIYSNMNSIFTKEYDYYGLTSSETLNYAGDFNDISGCEKGNSVIGDYSTILYTLELEYFNDELTTSNIKTAKALNSYTYQIGDQELGYGVGYYWFNLRGSFDHNGNKVKFADVNKNYANWLGWNYVYKSDETDAELNGCDGIFHIKERQIYLIINPEENEDGIIQAGGTNVPVVGEENYVYYWTYDGTNYLSSNLTTDLNTDGGNFSYGLYVQSTDSLTQSDIFININKYTTIGDVPVGHTFDYSANFIFNEGNLYDETTSPLDINYQSVFTANPNFALANSSPAMGIKALVLNVEVKLANTLLGGKSEITFNDSSKEKILVYEVNPLNVYPDSEDAKIRTKESIIEMVSYEDGRFIVTSEDKNREVHYVFRTHGQLVDGFYVDAPNSFFGQTAGTYSISGGNLGMNSYRYDINVVSVPFVIAPKPIVVDGVTRTYFNKQFENYALTCGENDNSTITSILGEINFSIYDNTKVDAKVGTFDDGNNSNYYVTIPKEDFVSIDPSYCVVVGTNFTPIGADTSTYVYLPLTIVKAPITVKVDISGEVEYGDLITSQKYSNSYSVLYQGFPELSSTYEYTYVNNKTGGAFVDTYDATAQSLQNDLKAIVEGLLIKKDDIVELIASTDYSADRLMVELKAYVTNENTEFDNYVIKWDYIYYTIAKKLVDFEINSNVSYHKNIDGTVTGNFSALWSEKDSLFYDPMSDEKLSYGIKVGEFELKETKYNSLEEQIKVIFNLTLNENNQYVSGNNIYNTIDEFLADTLNYIIVDQANQTEATTTVGMKNIMITGLSSSNFRFSYTPKKIMLYPEIETLGEYDTEEFGNYVNVISDAEAIAEGVTVLESTREITGLSMYVQFNFNGFGEDSGHQYFDVKNYGEFDIDSYSGMNYVRELKTYYLGKINGDSSDLTIQPSDYVYAQIVVKETFYANDYEVTVTNEITSNVFVIKFMQKSENNVIMDVINDKYDGGLKSQSSTDVESFDELLDNTTDAYYYNISETGINFNDVFDILTVRAKLISKANVDQYSYEIIVYENEEGKLIFGVTGGSTNYYYARMQYKNYYTRTVHETAQIAKGVQYYTFSQVSVVNGENISGKEYYMHVGNGYKRVSDTIADTSKIYYEKSVVSIANGAAIVGDYYVDFSESIITESLVDIFDGANHTINIQIDTLGEIVNVVETVSIRDVDMNGNDYTLDQRVVTADKNYYLYITVDNSQYIFSYIGGGYKAVYEKEVNIATYYVKTSDTVVDESKEYYTFIAVPTELTKEEFNNGTYYAWVEESQRFTIQTMYTKEGMQYYTINSLTHSEITDFSDVYEKTTSYSEDERYTVDIPSFFMLGGNTGIALNNVYAHVSKYSIKERLIITATNQNYIANVILMPNQSDNGEMTYIVSKANVTNVMEVIEKAIESISLTTISNGQVDDNAYNSTPNKINVNNRITYNCRITNANGVNVSGDINEFGLYYLNYEVVYNYGNDYSTVVYRTTIKLIVSSDSEEQLSLKEYILQNNNMTEADGTRVSVTSANPKVFSATENTKYFYTDKLNNYNHTSIAFDSYTFNGESSETWIYLRNSNIKLVSLFSKYGTDGLFKEIGFALRIKKAAGVVTSSLYVNIHNRESNTELVSVYVDETTSIDWLNKVNVINVDYVTTDEKEINYIIFRVYQKDVTTNKTALAWQSYVKPSLFNSIPQDSINMIMNGIDENDARYMGFSINNASFRLLKFDTGRATVPGVNFVKYDYADDIYGNVSTGAPYTNNILNEDDKVYMYSDEYDVPISFADNTVEVSFSFPNDSISNGFDINFTNTTPYISSSRVGNMANGQRTVYLRYRDNSMFIGFAKYDDYLYERINVGYDSIVAQLGGKSLNEYFMDGEQHTIALCIDRSVVYKGVNSNIYLANASEYLTNIASALDEYYMMSIKIDNTIKAYAVCPYYNDLSKFGLDEELSSTGRDKYFINNISYLGITLYGASTQLEVHDIATYNSKI